MKRYLIGLLAALLCLSACAADGPDGAGLCLAETDPAPEAGPVPSAGGESSSDAEASQLPQPNASWDVTEDITLSLLQAANPVGTQSLTMVLENRGGQKMLLGPGAVCEQYADEQWAPVETKSLNISGNPAYEAVIDYTLSLSPQSTTSFTIGTRMDSPLAEGLYRITGSALRTVDEQGQTVEEYPAYQLEFLVTEDASSEPDYAVFVSSRPVSPETDSLPIYLLTARRGRLCALHSHPGAGERRRDLVGGPLCAAGGLLRHPRSPARRGTFLGRVPRNAVGRTGGGPLPPQLRRHRRRRRGAHRQRRIYRRLGAVQLSHR